MLPPIGRLMAAFEAALALLPEKPWYLRWLTVAGATVGGSLVGLLVASRVHDRIYDRRLDVKRRRKRDACRKALNELVRRLQADKVNLEKNIDML